MSKFCISKIRRASPIQLLALTSILAAASAQAAIGLLIELSDLPEFDASISSTDLVNAGSSSLSTISSTPFFTVGGVNDGTSAEARAADSEYAAPSQFPATVVFHLDTGINPLGYDLTSLSTFAGFGEWIGDGTWSGRHHEMGYQRYTVSYSLVGEDTFTEFAAVEAGGTIYSKVTLVGLGSEVPGGVDAVSFTWLDPIPFFEASDYPNHTVTVIREIDVFGTPTANPVPEPGSLLIMGLAGGMFLFLRNRSGAGVAQ